MWPIFKYIFEMGHFPGLGYTRIFNVFYYFQSILLANVAWCGLDSVDLGLSHGLGLFRLRQSPQSGGRL